MKLQWLTFALTLAITSVQAGVSDLKSSGAAGRLDQVSDTYTPTPTKPSYQPDTVGGDWTPNIKLNNSGGTFNGTVSGTFTGQLSSSVTGTPSINLGNARGSIAGTTGTNSSISSAINSNSTGTWRQVSSGTYNNYSGAEWSGKVSSGAVCIKKTKFLRSAYKECYVHCSGSSEHSEQYRYYPAEYWICA